MLEMSRDNGIDDKIFFAERDGLSQWEAVATAAVPHVGMFFVCTELY